MGSFLFITLHYIKGVSLTFPGPGGSCRRPGHCNSLEVAAVTWPGPAGPGVTVALSLGPGGPEVLDAGPRRAAGPRAGPGSQVTVTVARASDSGVGPAPDPAATVFEPG